MLVAATFAAAPAQAQAALFFTGSVTCNALPGIASGGKTPVLITQRGYRADYQMDFPGLRDRGRGILTGLSLQMQGGGRSRARRVQTQIAATRNNRNYRIEARQTFGPNQTRTCQGAASLGLP